MKKSDNLQKKRTGFVKSSADNAGGGGGSESLTDSSSADSTKESSSSSSSRSSSETSGQEVKRKAPSASPPMLGWPIRKAELSKNTAAAADVAEAAQKTHVADDAKFKDFASKIAG